MVNITSGHRRSVFLTSGSRALCPSRRIRRIRKGDGKTLRLLARLVKRLVIQREPRMAVEIRDFFSYTTMKEHWIPQSSGKPIKSQRPWEAIPFFVIGKQLKPAIHIVNHILHHCLVRLPRHRARVQSVQHHWQTFHSQQETHAQHYQACAQHGPILFHTSDHGRFSVASLNENSSIPVSKSKNTPSDNPGASGGLSTFRRDPRRQCRESPACQTISCVGGR
jgi:hypothetical protein